MPAGGKLRSYYVRSRLSYCDRIVMPEKIDAAYPWTEDGSPSFPRGDEGVGSEGNSPLTGRVSSFKFLTPKRKIKQ